MVQPRQGGAERLLDDHEVEHDTTVARLRPGIIGQSAAGSSLLRYGVPALVPAKALDWLPVLPVLPLGRRLAVPMVHADDVAHAVVRILERHASGAFNRAAEPSVTAERIAEALGARLVDVPRAAVRAAVSVSRHARLQQVHPGSIDLGGAWSGGARSASGACRDRNGWPRGGHACCHPGTMQAKALLGAAHPGPALAVTVVAGLLAWAAPLSGPRVALVVLAVLAGQLVIGWSNDLVDVGRDRQVGRMDKPLATGDLSLRTLQVALAVAAVAAVVLSFALGWRAALAHLVAMVGGGVAYNLGLKSTRWSWAPYALAFGLLPAVVTLAQDPPVWPPWSVLVAAALLGVGAHFVNVLPDLADDAATGVRGLPHRLGRRTSQRAATGVLVLASVALVLGPGRDAGAFAWVGLAVTLGLAVVALVSRGRTPFRAAVGIALVNVAMLTLGGAGPS